MTDLLFLYGGISRVLKLSTNEHSQHEHTPFHPSGDPTPSPKDRRQFHRWLIGIDEDGIFINPELVAHTKHFAVASLPPRLMPAAATPHLMNR
jgi:hypothetical protein